MQHRDILILIVFKNRYKIDNIAKNIAKEIVIKNHYLHRQTPIKYCYGFYDTLNNNEIVGVIIYGISASTSLRKGICGVDEQKNVCELSRLWIKDGLPKNSASYLIANTLKLLPYEIIVSYADPSFKHTGVVYQATNWIYTGLSTGFKDPKLKSLPNKHHTSFAKGLTNAEVKEKYKDDVVFVKRVRKHRYVYFNASKKRKQTLLSKLTYPKLPYPINEFDCKPDEKKCIVCKQKFKIVDYPKGSKFGGKQYYKHECKICYKLGDDYKKKREQENKYRKQETFKVKRNAYRKTQSGLQTQRKYENNKRNNNPLFRCKHNIRNRLRLALKSKKWNKQSSFVQYIGCDKFTFEKHMENLFKPGMTWENYGFGVGKWNIDHIIPLSSAKTVEEMYKLAHYTNLQPLWHEENQKKTNKIQ